MTAVASPAVIGSEKIRDLRLSESQQPRPDASFGRLPSNVEVCI